MGGFVLLKTQYQILSGFGLLSELFPPLSGKVTFRIQNHFIRLQLLRHIYFYAFLFVPFYIAFYLKNILKIKNI